MKKKPPYPLNSVDNALLLLHSLRDQGEMSVTETTELLGVVPSTAHRLLAMLVYRDFAVKDGHKYRPGPSLFLSAVENRPTQELARILIPYMRGICERHDESVQLSVRSGCRIRFIANVECKQYLRVGDRRGTTLPARAASGGRALLAELAPGQLAELYRVGEKSGTGSEEEVLTQGEWAALNHSLQIIRIRGFAVSLPNTEPGVRAISVPFRNGNGEAVGAVSVAGPTTRMSGEVLEKLALDLKDVAEQAKTKLAKYGVGQ